MEPYLGQITLFAGNFAPRGWALCNGQLLSIVQNTALFSILGTTFGGDGVQTFGLPDLRGRVPIHPGQGPGLSSYSLGQEGGNETRTLATSQMPAHVHTNALAASSAEGTTRSPANAVPAAGGSYAGSGNTTLLASNTGVAGSSLPFDVLQPYTCINYIIAINGIFPSRN